MENKVSSEFTDSLIKQIEELQSQLAEKEKQLLLSQNTVSDLMIEQHNLQRKIAVLNGVSNDLQGDLKHKYAEALRLRVIAEDFAFHILKKDTQITELQSELSELKEKHKRDKKLDDDAKLDFFNQ